MYWLPLGQHIKIFVYSESLVFYLELEKVLQKYEWLFAVAILYSTSKTIYSKS